MKSFRLLSGFYTDVDKKRHGAGDKVESERDLCKIFKNKFERIIIEKRERTEELKEEAPKEEQGEPKEEKKAESSEKVYESTESDDDKYEVKR